MREVLCVMLDGEISKYVDIFYEELHRGARCHLTYSRCIYIYIYINDLIVAVEAAKQGVTVRESTVSGSMFAEDSWEYQKHSKDCRNK